MIQKNVLVIKLPFLHVGEEKAMWVTGMQGKLRMCLSPEAKVSGRPGLVANVGQPWWEFSGMAFVGVSGQQADLEVELVLLTLETHSKGVQGSDSLSNTHILFLSHIGAHRSLPVTPSYTDIWDLCQYSQGILAKEGSSSFLGLWHMCLVLNWARQRQEEGWR